MKTKTVFTIFLMFFIILTACAQNSGRLTVNRDVTDLFESYTVSQDYNYYYHGPDNYPRVIIGVSKKYRLSDTIFWKLVDLKPEQIKKWLNYPRPRVGRDFSRRGKDIIGPQGEAIGVWYPVRDWKDLAMVRLNPENSVVIGAPIEDQSNRSILFNSGGD